VHAASLRTAANADFSTALKCLASSKKSLQQLRPDVHFITRAVTILLHLHTSCISLCTIPTEGKLYHVHMDLVLPPAEIPQKDKGEGYICIWIITSRTATAIIVLNPFPDVAGYIWHETFLL